MAEQIKAIAEIGPKLKNLSTETWSVITATIFGTLGVLVNIKKFENIGTILILSVPCAFLAFTTLRALKLTGQILGETKKYHETVLDEKLNVSQEISALHSQLFESRQSFRDLENHVKDSDRAFRLLAVDRMRLDTKFSSLSSKELVVKKTEMSKALGIYFEEVCQHIVDIVSARLHVSKDDIAVDIKIISDIGKKYRVVGRSNPNSLEARERIKKRSLKDRDKRDLVSNLHLKYATESSKHENLIEDLKKWRKSKLHNYAPSGIVTAPPESAEEFYRTSLTVAMYIEKDDENDSSIGVFGKDARVNLVNERIYGFISIDSLNKISFSGAEKSILHEISLNTLSEIRLYDTLLA